MTTAEAITALESGNFDAFLGVSEGGNLDFKGAPYDLTTDVGKFELAKDVVAFANAGVDSLIVIGIEAEREQESPFERVKRVRPLPTANVDAKRYRDVIRARCYPSLRGLEVTVFLAPTDESRCLFAIRIPAQPESNRPFLVQSAMSAEGEKLQGWLVGLPTRALDATEHMRVDQLHETFLRGQAVGGRLEEIVGLLAHSPDQTERTRRAEPTLAPRSTVPSGSDAHRSNEQLVERGKKVAAEFAREPNGAGGFAIAPALFLTVAPIGPSTVPTLFHQSGVREIIERPPLTRSDGWNLATLNRAEIIEGRHLRVVSGRRKLVDLDEDGVLLAIGRFDLLLTISRPAYAEREYRKVNCLALIEFIHDFVLAAQTILAHVESVPDRAEFAVGLISTKTPSASLFLPPGELGSLAYEIGAAEPPDKPEFSWSFVVEQEPKQLDVGVVAFELVKRVYAYFKRTVDEIPYLSERRDAVDSSSFGRRV